jgi:hypothetical protein
VSYTVVTFATRVLPFHTPVAVAASTLVVAALVNPLLVVANSGSYRMTR